MVRLRGRGGLVADNASLLSALRYLRARRWWSRRRSILLLGVDLGSSWRWLVGGRHLSAVQWRRLGVRLHSVTVLSGSVVLLRSTVILVVDDALHLRFEARALVPRDKPLMPMLVLALKNTRLRSRVCLPCGMPEGRGPSSSYAERGCSLR